MLGAVKTEFSKFGMIIEQARKKLDAARDELEKTETRTRKINSRLRAVEDLPVPERPAYPGLTPSLMMTILIELRIHLRIKAFCKGVKHEQNKQIRGLVFWIIITFSAAAIGSVASMQAKSFYSLLTRPSWAPPAWIFGPVWTFLYILMALDAWMLWREAGGFREAEKPLAAYIVQLAVNSLWTWLFFAWNRAFSPSPALSYSGVSFWSP